jgi:predicted Zn finger-like uncharacterized protein
MIIQCDQCDTKFKLDDAKVPDKGIKVRCAKCKHVFMVQKESTPEELDLDFLLSGLGAPTPAAEKGLPQRDEVPASTTSGEEWPTFAQGTDSLGEGTGGSLAVEDAGLAKTHGFDKDFFAVEEDSADLEKKSFDLGEFSFENEDMQPQNEAAVVDEATYGKPEGGEFGELPSETETEPDAAVLQPSIPDGTAEFDFISDNFETGEPSDIKPEVNFGKIDVGEYKEGEHNFGEELRAQQDETQGVGEKPGLFTKSEEAYDFGEFAVAPQEQNEVDNPILIAQDENKEAETKPLEFGEIDFGDTSPARSETIKEEVEKEPEIGISQESGAEAVPSPSFAYSTPAVEEDLPPLAIATRKKGGSFISIAVTTIAVLIVLVIAGVGFYVLKEGPAAFNKLGLSFLAKWAGMDVAEEGGIAITNPTGAFMVNREAGEIFVVSGEAINNFKTPRASIQVKAIVLGQKGEALMQKTAYCGNALSKEQLTTLPMAKIEEAMGSPFGDSLANLGVQPGKSIPFVIVFNGVQKNASEFSVEVVGSTVASQ